MAPLGDRGLRVAVVGLGRSEAHVAGYLLAGSQPGLRVDVLEAPMEIGRAELLSRYQGVIYAFGGPGAQAPPIPGAELAGAAPATSFLSWVRGHPERGDDFDLRCRRAIVIGSGDVALEVARVLARGIEPTPDSDVSAAFARSALEEVVVVGREGPEQAAFTPSQLRQLGGPADVDVVADAGELAVPAPYRELDPTASIAGNLALLHEYAARPRRDGRRRIALRFLLSPTRILGLGRVQAIELVRNTLERDADGRLRARATAARATIPTGLVISAVDEDRRAPPGLPVDAHGKIIADEHGRVREADGRPTGEYLSGHGKPVVGGDRASAVETVRVLLADLAAGCLGGSSPPALP